MKSCLQHSTCYVAPLNKNLLCKHCQAMPCLGFKGQLTKLRTVWTRLLNGWSTTVWKADQNRCKSPGGFLQGRLLSSSARDVVTSKSKWVLWQKEISHGKNRGGLMQSSPGIGVVYCLGAVPLNLWELWDERKLPNRIGEAERCSVPWGKFVKRSGRLWAYLVPAANTRRVEMWEDGWILDADWELPFQNMLWLDWLPLLEKG